MNLTRRVIKVAALAIILVAIFLLIGLELSKPGEIHGKTGTVTVHDAAAFDVSQSLAMLRTFCPAGKPLEPAERGQQFGPSPPDPDSEPGQSGGRGTAAGAAPPVSAARAAIEQTSPGPRPPAVLIESFDGLGFGFAGPQGAATVRNPSDNSLAAGPDHIQDGKATVHDPMVGDWPAINTLVSRVSAHIAAHPDTSASSSSRNDAEKYKILLEGLNNNTIPVAPSNPAGCPPRL